MLKEEYKKTRENKCSKKIEIELPYEVYDWLTNKSYQSCRSFTREICYQLNEIYKMHHDL